MALVVGVLLLVVAGMVIGGLHIRNLHRRLAKLDRELRDRRALHERLVELGSKLEEVLAPPPQTPRRRHPLRRIKWLAPATLAWSAGRRHRLGSALVIAAVAAAGLGVFVVPRNGEEGPEAQPDAMAPDIRDAPPTSPTTPPTTDPELGPTVAEGESAGSDVEAHIPERRAERSPAAPLTTSPPITGPTVTSPTSTTPPTTSPPTTDPPTTSPPTTGPDPPEPPERPDRPNRCHIYVNVSGIKLCLVLKTPLKLGVPLL